MNIRETSECLSEIDWEKALSYYMGTISQNVISTILRHDNKVASYKIALLRAINDVALAFPGLNLPEGVNIAVPLHMLAEFWIAYYWPFMDVAQPILQGPLSVRDGQRRNDLSFRPELTALRSEWETTLKTSAQPSDGFYLVSEFKSPRRRATYPSSLQKAYDQARTKTADALKMPIRYAGPEGEWSVFPKPQRFRDLSVGCIGVPGIQSNDMCLLLGGDLWAAFRELSLWIEALCVHEWSLFSERVGGGSKAQNDGEVQAGRVERGQVYTLLTARPDNRRPLQWERNQVEMLMLEGFTFTCPWTSKPLTPANYDLDHLLPLAVYPVNELWNLLPTDRHFNQRVKRDRIPSTTRLSLATPLIAEAYGHYDSSEALGKTVREDAAVRFADLPSAGSKSHAAFSILLAQRAVQFMEEVASARNVRRF